MARQSARSHGERGQMIVLFVLASTVILLAVGLVIDGANALAQRRESQNASDFAALAGARVVAEWVAATRPTVPTPMSGPIRTGRPPVGRVGHVCCKSRHIGRADWTPGFAAGWV